MSGKVTHVNLKMSGAEDPARTGLFITNPLMEQLPLRCIKMILFDGLQKLQRVHFHCETKVFLLIVQIKVYGCPSAVGTLCLDVPPPHRRLGFLSSNVIRVKSKKLRIDHFKVI